MSIIVVNVLLVPVLIWSGRGITKQSDIVTIGTEPKPQQMTMAEKKEFSQRLTVESGIRFEEPTTPPVVRVADAGEYAGMVQAELDKVARWRQIHGTSGNASNSTPAHPQGVQRTLKIDLKSISTVETIPRTPGIEGMTLEERAKLDAYLKNRK